MSSYLRSVPTKSITQHSLVIAAPLQPTQPVQCSAALYWTAVRTEESPHQSSNPGAIFYVASNNIDVLSSPECNFLFHTESADIDREHSSRQYKLTLNYQQNKAKTAEFPQSHHITRGEWRSQPSPSLPAYYGGFFRFLAYWAMVL